MKNIHLAAPAIDELGTFYAGILGTDPEFVDEAGWVQFRVGGIAVAVAGPGEAPSGASGWIPTFESQNLERAATDVRSGGGDIVDTRDMGAHGVAVVATDPLGNHFVLWSAARS